LRAQGYVTVPWLYLNVHNRVFGLGFLRSCADKQSYVQFTTGMFHYYSTMENCFDRGTGIVNQVWSRFPELRRSEKLHKDLLDVGAVLKTQDPQSLPISAATAAYCHDIKAASQVDGGTPLLGHLYVRYFAGRHRQLNYKKTGSFIGFNFFKQF
jgi:heme oxygenase